jgi:hypothetical protein
MAASPRILRDFSRLISLIKSVAIIRSHRRKIDTKGRIVAELADYAVILGEKADELAVLDPLPNPIRVVESLLADAALPVKTKGEANADRVIVRS